MYLPPVQGKPGPTEKRRTIQFACGAKPVTKDAAAMPPPPKSATAARKEASPEVLKRRTCIKFACPSKPGAAAPATPPRGPNARAGTTTPARDVNTASPSVSVRKFRSPSTGNPRTARSATPRRSSHSPIATRSKPIVGGDSQELRRASAQFHEFASDVPQEDDWIRADQSATKRKLTIDDTFKLELAFKKLTTEVEEEEAQEEEDDADEDETVAGGDVEDLLDDDEDDVEDEKLQFGYPSADLSGASDGYRTDSEIGFASSEDEDDELVLWTTHTPGQQVPSVPMYRRPSFGEHSDSSASSKQGPKPRRRRTGSTAIRFRPGTPELPDSTDFVCGTLDEDRPLEDAYMSCLAARRLEKLHVIPQDIDPSFPTDEPGDEDDEEEVAVTEPEDHVLVHGELEDLHHEHGRKKKGDSPRRYRSPAPKRHHSPAPKRHHSPAPKRHHSPPPKRLHSPPPRHVPVMAAARGRSPRRAYESHSPTSKHLSPAPSLRTRISFHLSPVHTGAGITFKPVSFCQPSDSHKSLPKPGPVFATLKQAGTSRRSRTHTLVSLAATGNGGDQHVRGAIDIVKGLEQKRQRRREKFLQKYCNRARLGQVHEKRPQPGKGAERMKEWVTGKIGQGNYVLSV